MNKKKLQSRRLVLHRETLLRLDERKLRTAAGDGVIQPISQGNICTSPLCVETTCNCAETVIA
jgi:hypothetical protein